MYGHPSGKNVLCQVLEIKGAGPPLRQRGNVVVWGLSMDSDEWGERGEWVGHKFGSKISTLTWAANSDLALSCLSLSRFDKNVFPDHSA
jgi:hypothetical protein